MTPRHLLDAMPCVHPTVDRNGAPFVLPEHVYRAFRGDSAAFYRRLLHSDDVEGLFRAGLVRCWEADVEIEGFEYVVEGERVPVGGQWMVGSRRHLIVPLILRRLRLHGAADAVLRAHQTVGAKGFWDSRFLRPWFPPGFGRLATRGRHPAAYFHALLEYVERLPDGAGRSVWSDYEQGHGARVADPSTYQGKQQAVDALLRQVEPGLVLDLGANAGWYSELAVRHGNRVIAVDTDDWTLSLLYRMVKERTLPILPLRLDIMWPTGSYGMALGFQGADTRRAARHL